MVAAGSRGTIVPLSLADVRRTTVREFFSNELDHVLLPDRGIRVWLPPGYDDDALRQKRLPTLYVHDGEGIMRKGPNTWGLDGTLSRLIAAGEVEAPIVVMIDSTGQDGLNAGPAPIVRRRWLEYGGYPLLGERYLSFVADELKPAIDRRFRTLAAPEHTHTMGSSMGGLCAFLSVWERPDVFGGAACLSPVFQAPLLADVALNGGRRLKGTRLYIDNGGDTPERKVPIVDLDDGPDPGWWWLDTNLQPGVDAMCAALTLQRVDFSYFREPGGRHNERAWGARCERPLRHLLSGRGGRAR